MIIAAMTNDTVLHPLLVNPPQITKNVPRSVVGIISPRSILCTKTASNVRGLVVPASPITSKVTLATAPSPFIPDESASAIITSPSRAVFDSISAFLLSVPA